MQIAVVEVVVAFGLEVVVAVVVAAAVLVAVLTVAAVVAIDDEAEASTAARVGRRRGRLYSCQCDCRNCEAPRSKTSVCWCTW